MIPEIVEEAIEHLEDRLREANKIRNNDTVRRARIRWLARDIWAAEEVIKFARYALNGKNQNVDKIHPLQSAGKDKIMCPKCGSNNVGEVVRGTMKCWDCGHTWPIKSAS